MEVIAWIYGTITVILFVLTTMAIFKTLQRIATVLERWEENRVKPVEKFEGDKTEFQQAWDDIVEK